MQDQEGPDGGTSPFGEDPADWDPADVASADPGGVQAEEIFAFWEMARGRARLGRLESVMGPTPASAVPPQAWSFGDTPRLADELLALVLDGAKTATASSLAELAATGEPMPRTGDLSILLDGAGHPRALIRTTAVTVLPFREVTAEQAAAEGEDDRTLASWRREHERYFRRVLAGTGTEFSPDLPIAFEEFELLYPRASDR